jgi:hypothetical protein
MPGSKLWYTNGDGVDGDGDGDGWISAGGSHEVRQSYYLDLRNGLWHVRYPLPRRYGRGACLTSRRSTGTADRAEAEKWAEEHAKEIIGRKVIGAVREGTLTTFRQFAAGWWEPDCEYITYMQSRKRRCRIGARQLENKRNYLSRHILPVFGPARLTEITTDGIDGGLDDMLAAGSFCV